MSLQPAMDRPSNDKAKRLLDAMRGGADLDTALLFANLTEADLAPEVWDEIVRLRAEAVVRAVAQIQKAAHQGDWKAAAWWLERALPAKYGKQSERVNAAVYEMVCPEGHIIATTHDQAVICGICGQPMNRQ